MPPTPSNCEVDLVNESGEESEEEDAFISFTTTESKCETSFQRGLEFKINGELTDALSCFSDCLEGMQTCQYFVKLPQTLQQLESVNRALGYEEKAKEYGRAEKLFQEATQVQGTPSEGVSQPRTKRRPFSRKSSRFQASSCCNPGEYGNLILKKADQFDEHARLHAGKGDMELALDYCGKVLTLRQCVYGENHSVVKNSLNYCRSLYAERERRKDRLTPTAGPNFVNNYAKDDTPALTECNMTDGIDNVNTMSTGRDKLTEDHGTNQVKVHTGSHKNETLVSNKPEHLDRTDRLTEGQKFHNVPCVNNGTKQGPGFLDQHLRSGTQECIQDRNCPGDSPGHWVIGVHHQVSNYYPQHFQQGNLCTGMTSNLTKLSAELKAPMCVTMDIQTVGPRTGMEHPRCLPLWVLLLGAFVEMSLLAYMLYYH